MGLQSDVVQCFFQSDIVQVEVEVLSSCGVDALRIAQHVDSGQLAHAFVQHPRRLIIDAEAADLVGNGPQHRRAFERADALLHFLAGALCRGKHGRSRRSGGALLKHHSCVAHALQRYLRGRISQKCFLKFSQGFFQFAFALQASPDNLVRVGGFGPYPLVHQQVGRLVRIGGDRLIVISQRRVIIFGGFRFLASFQQLIAFSIACAQRRRQQRESTHNGGCRSGSMPKIHGKGVHAHVRLRERNGPFLGGRSCRSRSENGVGRSRCR